MILKLGVLALALGLDVWAVSAAIGVARLNLGQSLRLALVFASAEIGMMLGGYGLGHGAGHVLGQVATYAGFALLALIGLLMAYQARGAQRLHPWRGSGMALTALSISLDSLGVGFALPAALGARLGKRYGWATESLAGGLLVILAIVFALERWREGRW